MCPPDDWFHRGLGHELLEAGLEEAGDGGGGGALLVRVAVRRRAEEPQAQASGGESTCQSPLYLPPQGERREDTADELDLGSYVPLQ